MRFDGAQELVWHEVTPEMGKVSFQGPSCSKPMKKVAGITAFFKSPGAGGKTGSHIIVRTPAKRCLLSQCATPRLSVHNAGLLTVVAQH